MAKNTKRKIAARPRSRKVKRKAPASASSLLDLKSRVFVKPLDAVGIITARTSYVAREPAYFVKAEKASQWWNADEVAAL